MVLSMMTTVALSSLAGVLLYAGLAPQLGGRIRGPRKARIEASPNVVDGRFRNPVETRVGGEGRSQVKATTDYFLGGQERVPRKAVPVDRVDPASLEPSSGDALRVWWLGHSTVLLDVDGALVLTDPVFAKRVGPLAGVGPRRFNDRQPITADELPPLDAVVISHDHYDHLGHGAIRALKDKVGAFFVPLGVGAHLERWGVRDDKIVELDWWEEGSHGDLTLTLTPTRHFSGRRGTDSYKTLWGSWVVRGSRHSVFFSGDSGYWDGFAEIGRRSGPFDLTLMECGAYNEGWASIHMMPEETAQAHRDLQGDLLMPIHWGKFNLSLHAWTEPVERLLAAAEEPAIRVATPRIGQGFDASQTIPQAHWWRDVASTRISSGGGSGGSRRLAEVPVKR